MPRTKVSVPDVAEAGPDLWSNAIRAGDMLFVPPGSSRLVRIHGAYVSDTEIDRIVDAANPKIQSIGESKLDRLDLLFKCPVRRY